MGKAQVRSATRPAPQPTTERPEMSLRQRVAAEIIGTFFLVFLGAGAGATAKVIPHILGAAPSLTDWQLVALGNGFARFIITMIFGKVSGHCSTQPSPSG
ncbi:MAG TPA: aquaporin [Ktedonobacterales bacterium]|nr:aquaporin [Ktedonobacterales bacterium]